MLHLLREPLYILYDLQEQQAILLSEDVGVDEDSAESLIKKNKALMQDVERFGQTVNDLHEEAKQCKV